MFCHWSTLETNLVETIWRWQEVWKLLRVSVKCDVSGVLLLILIKKFVWHAEHEWVNFLNKFGLHQSKTEGDTEDWIRDKVWNMLARNLKSVRGMRKKTKTCG